jgi:hypothetical protein
LEVRLHGIALHIVKRDAGKTLSEKVGEAQSGYIAEILSCAGLDWVGYLVQFLAGAGGHNTHYHNLLNILGKRLCNYCGRQERN